VKQLWELHGQQQQQQLEQLGLTEAVLDWRLELAAQKHLPYADFLLLGSETTAWRER